MWRWRRRTTKTDGEGVSLRERERENQRLTIKKRMNVMYLNQWICSLRSIHPLWPWDRIAARPQIFKSLCQINQSWPKWWSSPSSNCIESNEWLGLINPSIERARKRDSSQLVLNCNRHYYAAHAIVVRTSQSPHEIVMLFIIWLSSTRLSPASPLLSSNHHMRLQTHDLKFKFRISRQQTIVRRRRLSSRGSVYFVWDCESLSAVGSHLTTTTGLIIQLVVHNCQHVGSTLHDGWMNVKLGKTRRRE